MSADGLCECGCGWPTMPARRTDPRRGHVKGEPTRFRRGHQRRTSPIAFVLDADSGCWIWQRACFPSGYGVANIGGRMGRAHRLYYEQLVGPLPDDIQLHHTCENKRCINPDHLEPLSHDEHAAVSPLSHRGSRNPSAKFSEDDVRDIKRRLERGETHHVIATDLDVTSQCIAHIDTGRTWKEVTI